LGLLRQKRLLIAYVKGLKPGRNSWLAGEPHKMAGLVDTVTLPLPDLTPVAAEAGAAEGGPQQVYTWAGPPGDMPGVVRSYSPSDGGAPRLVAASGHWDFFGVWETGTGAFLQALHAPTPGHVSRSLLTYQRPSDGRPRIAAGFYGGHDSIPQLGGIWDGDDFHVRTAIDSSPSLGSTISCLAVYEEPMGGRTRLVTG
jgi:hypothetical protein